MNNNKLSVFKVFQQGDEYFEVLNDPHVSKKYLGRQILTILILSVLYGLIMGSFNGFLQSLVTGVKVPVLVFLSLLVCFPAFYVIQFMIGSKMTVVQMANMILSGFVVFTTIALSFAPIVIFFMITGNNYAFVKLLHVGILLFSGVFGMIKIVSGLKYSCESKKIYPKTGLNVFKIWFFIFAFVGVQLAWNLRPFVGSKELPFELFREKEGNFYLAVLQSIRDLFKEPETEPDSNINRGSNRPTGDLFLFDSTQTEIIAE